MEDGGERVRGIAVGKEIKASEWEGKNGLGRGFRRG